MGESHWLPMQYVHTRSTHAFDIVHVDIWGPSPILAISCARFFILFVDDFSRYHWLYLMESKEQVCNIFLLFKAFIER